MLRKIVVALTILLCSMATQVYALGLGTVTVESALNQPLRLRIELLQLGETRLQDIRVSMASGEDFERFNIERTGFLSNVRFSVESTQQGNVVILTSSQIVREPYLSFILDTRWPNGRLLSEHTILLDLPVFNDRQSATEVRQPISPILEPPANSQAADADPFVDSRAQAVVSAPSSATSAGNLQPEVIAIEPDQAEAETQAVETVQQPEAIVAEEVAVEAEPVREAVEEEPIREEPATVESLVEEVAEEVIVEEPAVEEEPVEEVLAEQLVEETAEVEPEAIEAAQEPAEPETTGPEVVEPETFETEGSDTLSEIALQVRPSSSVSTQQTMLALQELNPDAFDDGNINRLRGGEILRVPSLEEIQAIDPRDAIDEVSRQNQEFAEADIQPLAAPSAAEPVQDEQPQGQLSVVSSDDAIDAGGGATPALDAESVALDQRIAELEAELAQRQEDADRARIEREELDSRMADLEAQIAASQEIIRLQDIQLAQLQEAFALAAAEAQLVADQQAAQAEAAQPVAGPTSLLDDVLRILTGNIIFMVSGIALVILLLVVLMLRRNRAAETDKDEIDEIAEQEFDADDPFREVTDDEEETEDYDPLNSDVDLDEIVADADRAQADENAKPEDSEQLDVIAIADQLIDEQQYRRALSMLNTSLQEQGDDHAVKAKISDVESLIEAEDSASSEDDKDASAEAEASRESETKSFLDDLGIDLDSFDYDQDDDGIEVVDETDTASESDPEPEAASEDMDLSFEFDEDESSSKSTSMDDEQAPEVDDKEEVETFEFDLDEESVAVESEAKDAEELDIDTLEFDSNAVEEVKADAPDESEVDDVDLETFSFDVDPPTDSLESGTTDSSIEVAESEEPEEDPNAVEFSFDKEEIEVEAAPEASSNEELETFDFDLDEDAGDTVLEKPVTETSSSAADFIDLDDEDEDFDFDLDGFTFEAVEEEATTAADSTETEIEAEADVDFLDLDAPVEAAGSDDIDTSDEDFLDLDAENKPIVPNDTEADIEIDAEDDFLDMVADVEDVAASDESADGDEDFLDLDAEIEEVTSSDSAVVFDDEIEFEVDQVDEPASGGDEAAAVDTESESEAPEDDLEFLSDDDVEIESVDDIEEVDMLSADDETATKLELAYAYQKMGDKDGSREILQEVVKEGSDEQIAEAKKLLESMDGETD